MHYCTILVLQPRGREILPLVRTTEFISDKGKQKNIAHPMNGKII